MHQKINGALSDLGDLGGHELPVNYEDNTLVEEIILI